MYPTPASADLRHGSCLLDAYASHIAIVAQACAYVWRLSDVDPKQPWASWMFFRYLSPLRTVSRYGLARWLSKPAPRKARSASPVTPESNTATPRPVHCAPRF